MARRHTVALQGIDFYSRMLPDGVELYDVPSRGLTNRFAGPRGAMWAFDGRLYVNSGRGFEIWLPDGVRIGWLPDFHPTAHNPVTGAFADLADGLLSVWTPS